MITLREGWYAAALANAQRIHGDRVTDGEPHWKLCHTAAERLLQQQPDATRDEVEAAVLADALHVTTTATLRMLGVRKPVLDLLTERNA